MKEVAKAERERLRELKRQQTMELERVREDQNKKIAGDNKAGKWKFLLAQTEVFAHFLSGTKAANEAANKGKRGRNKSHAAEESEDAELVEHAEDYQAVRLTSQPTCIKFGKMREYQIAGLNWMIRLFDHGINGILADEMGLGKTLQTISLLGYLAEYRGVTGPHMVVVPKSTLGNWMNEFKRWCPMIRTFKFHGNAEEREAQKAKFLVPGGFDVCVLVLRLLSPVRRHRRAGAARARVRP